MCCFNWERCDGCCKRLGCGCKEHKDEERLESVTEINRSCTDIPCIGLFGVFITTMVAYVWMAAFAEGDPDRLIRGVNHAGQICGKSAGVEKLKYAFWPDLNSFRFKVCTDNCTEATLIKYAENHIAIPNIPMGTQGYESDLYLSKYCIPSLDSLEVEGFDDDDNSAQRSIGDFDLAMPVFGAAIAIAFVMSFLFVWLMKVCIKAFVWGVVALIIVCGMALSYTLYGSKDDENLSDKEQDMRLYAAVVIAVCTLIFFFIIVFARKRIMIAIEVIKSAGRAFGDMPWMVVFPIGPILAAIAFFWAWVFAAVYIFSAGETSMKDTPTDYIGVRFHAEDPNGDGAVVGAEFEVIDYSSTVKNAFAPHFFLLLWVVQFFVYFVFTVISGAVANWYFTERDADGKKKRGGDSKNGELSHRAVLKSCCRTARFHLGTVIFAAAIIAMVQFARAVVTYLEKTMGAKTGKEPNKIQKVLFRVVGCFLWCLECCLDKVNGNALIWVAIHGDAFCPSVCSSFKLIWANLVRVAAISFFSAMVTMLGKVLIPLMTMAICAAVLLNSEPYKSELSSPILPLVVVFIIAYGVAQMFLTVYDTAIDTIFLCFLLDEKHNKANGQMLADPDLRAIVQKYEVQSKELAEQKQRRSGGGGGADQAYADDSEKEAAAVVV